MHWVGLMATSTDQTLVLQDNFSRYALIESENTQLKHQLDFERAINQAHKIAAEKASCELEKLRKLISEIDALHEPCHESMIYCEDCGEEFPCQTRILLDSRED
jgi:ABC-type phosphate transport system auxiliary subunit